MQNWTLSELDSGERVITERLDHVRSVAVGYWIGAGARDETPQQAGVTHFIEHLLFKGSKRFDALEIAEIFDGLGGELNAATSREHTLIYSRVPDNQLETALDVMGDMVFAPVFEELDAEREVVLEEIAMYEDTPQELVHDLISEAVFGDHPLGRPVIGTVDVISSIPRDAIAGYHDEMYTPRNIVVAAAGNVEHERVVELVSQALERRGEVGRLGAERPAAARPGAAARAAVPAQGHRAVPRLPGRSRHRAHRPPPLRGLAARRDPRRLGVVAALPGDPREARAWRTRSTRSRRSTPTRARSASTSARARTTSPRRSRSRPTRSPTSRPATSPTAS